MELSIVIPCYNEEESVLELHRRVQKACSDSDVKSYEIILVNDGSKDNTLSLMKDIVENDKDVVIVNLSRNHGHQLALSAGLSEAKGQYIFVLDADLQDPPELLQPMLDRAHTGIEVVYGQRLRRKGETWLKRKTARAFYKLLSFLSDTEIPENVGDFRLMSRRVLDKLLEMPEQQRFIRGMIAWIGFKQEAYIYERDPRFAGVTKYPFWKLVHFAMDAISSFSIRPIRIAIPFAMIGVLIALILAFYAVHGYFFGATVPGWASLACIIAFFSSMQLLCIGLIGEYIGRTYIEVKRRPLFIVQEVLRSSKKSSKMVTKKPSAKAQKKSSQKTVKKTAKNLEKKPTKNNKA